MPQWYFSRDGAFGNWDKSMDEAWLAGGSRGWWEKEDRAVFRGAIRQSTLIFNETTNALGWINTNPDNWHVFGRGKLWKLSQERPDLFDVGLTRASSVPELEAILQSMNWAAKPSLTMNEQAEKYRYVIYLEGTCGWADRLKNLLASGLTIFLQTTPCHEFFLPLLRPWIHYIPVRNDLGDLVERVEWARANPEAAQEIGLNGAELARTQLRREDWRAYMEAVFEVYSGLMRYHVQRRNGTVRFRGSVRCIEFAGHKANPENTNCDDSAAFVS